MPVTDFILPTGGFLPPLPLQARKEIEARYPNLDVKRVERVFSYYIVARDNRMEHPSPKDARKQLSALRKCVTELSKGFSDLGPLSHTARLAAASLDRHDEYERIEEILSVAERTLGKAEEMIPRGRPISQHTLLVQELAAIIQNSGLIVDARAGGVLTTVTAIMLEHAGENPGSASKIVSDAFGSRRTKRVSS